MLTHQPLTAATYDKHIHAHKSLDKTSSSECSNTESSRSTTRTPSLDSLIDVQINIDKRVSVDINDKTTLSEHLNSETPK